MIMRNDDSKFARIPKALAILLLPALSSCSAMDPASRLAIHNPYEGVDWERTAYVHSMSHFHSGRPADERQAAYDMGLRHLIFTNYYPSEPLYPPAPEWVEQFPGATFGPNAEHHSFTDSDAHVNGLGSMFRSGYGHPAHSVPGKANPASGKGSPLSYRFDDVNEFDPDRPWLGIYRLDLTVEGDRDAKASVSIRGAEQVDPRSFETVGDGRVASHAVRCANEGCAVRSEQLYLRSLGRSIDVTVDYDIRAGRITQFRLMQGTNRPWRDVFRAILDGERPEEGTATGLLYPDGGGITINHPTQTGIEQYIEMLDFDDRVLGIEVWNDRRWFGIQDSAPHDRYYRHWDALLSTGRRVFGFFVKDHMRFARGRNVLLVPEIDHLEAEEREQVLLRAYREGSFFGVLGASAVNDEGEVAPPYDLTNFRFSRITVDRGEGGRPVLSVAVAGNDEGRRPEVVIRFITEEGIVGVHRATTATFPLLDGNGKHPKYVRVEAFALPRTHLGGAALDVDALSRASVYEIARLHDRVGHVHPNLVDEPGAEPIPIADMIFSQAIRIAPRSR